MASQLLSRTTTTDGMAETVAYADDGTDWRISERADSTERVFVRAAIGRLNRVNTVVLDPATSDRYLFDSPYDPLLGTVKKIAGQVARTSSTASCSSQGPRIRSSGGWIWVNRPRILLLVWVICRARSRSKTAGKWIGEHKGVIAGGAIALAGVALMFTGVGGPAGLALMAASGGMISGGMSMANQELSTGKIDWSTVAKDAGVGALSGALGGGSGAFIAMKTAGKTLSLGSRAAIGAGSGAVEGAATSSVERLIKNDGKIETSELGAATLAGALPGGVTAYKPKWLSWDTTKTFKYGFYRSGYNHKPEILNRVGNDNRPLGEFWSHGVPQNLAQVRNDKALPLHWQSKNHEEGYNPNYGPTSYTTRYQAEFKEYTERYSGIVAPQRDGKYQDKIYPGGTEQMYIPKYQWEIPLEGETRTLPQKGTIINSSPLPQ